jgi:hypothetical protein
MKIRSRLFRLIMIKNQKLWINSNFRVIFLIIGFLIFGKFSRVNIKKAKEINN